MCAGISSMTMLFSTPCSGRDPSVETLSNDTRSISVSILKRKFLSACNFSIFSFRDGQKYD